MLDMKLQRSQNRIHRKVMTEDEEGPKRSEPSQKASTPAFVDMVKREHFLSPRYVVHCTRTFYVHSLLDTYS